MQLVLEFAMELPLLLPLAEHCLTPIIGLQEELPSQKQVFALELTR